MNFFLTLLIILLTSLLSVSTPAASLIPALPAGVASEPVRKSSEPAKTETESERLKKLLKAAKADFERVNSPGGLAIGAPPGTPEAELVRRRFLLRLLTRNYERHLTELANGAIWVKKRKELDLRTAEGVSFKEKPPYSVIMVERLREQVQVGLYRVKDVEIAIETVTVKIQNAEDSLKKAEERERTLQEEIGKESEPAVVAALEWKLGLAALGRKNQATAYAGLQAAHKSAEEELLVVRQEFAFLEKKLEKASKESRFTEEDLQNIKERIEGRKRQFEAELENALAENQALLKRSLLAERKILTGIDLSAGGEASRKKRSPSLVEELYREEVENSNLKIETYQDMLDLNRREQRVWELRYAAEAKGDTGSTRSIIKLLPKVLTELEHEEQSAALRLRLVLRQLNEKESELSQLEQGKEPADIKRFIEVYQVREKLIMTRMREAEALKSVFVRLQDQYSETAKKAATVAKLKYWQYVVFEKIGNLWKYELFTTEASIVVDGKEIKGKRGITIGKIAVAVFILSLGYIAGARITKKIVRYLVNRYAVQESSAMLVRRWTMALLLILLLLYSLNLVRIPLTAFAFLGGAIAIGVGFGMQVLMKNLISGLMLLTERPFRVGDLVDVDGIRGRVTNIGIRSSTIRDVSGIETLIPNSTFVEKNVTNWTYSTHQVRYSVSVGVAYGSDVSVVRGELLHVASLHGQLLKDPEPIATLDDFASDTLMFGLFYWIDLESGTDPRIIASDLRIMIEKQLKAEGIVIAYPQRDVHLDSIRPLQVEVVSRQADASPAL